MKPVALIATKCPQCGHEGAGQAGAVVKCPKCLTAWRSGEELVTPKPAPLRTGVPDRQPCPQCSHTFKDQRALDTHRRKYHRTVTGEVGPSTPIVALAHKMLRLDGVYQKRQRMDAAVKVLDEEIKVRQAEIARAMALAQEAGWLPHTMKESLFDLMGARQA